MEKMWRITKQLETVLSERLDSYALIGFDPEGNQISITHTPTDLHTQAINAAFREWYEECFEADPIEAECEWEDEDE
jgi:hypothetical protein